MVIPPETTKQPDAFDEPDADPSTPNPCRTSSGAGSSGSSGIIGVSPPGYRPFLHQMLQTDCPDILDNFLKGATQPPQNGFHDDSSWLTCAGRNRTLLLSHYYYHAPNTTNQRPACRAVSFRREGSGVPTIQSARTPLDCQLA